MAITDRWLEVVLEDLDRARQEWGTCVRQLQTLSLNPSSVTPAQLLPVLQALNHQVAHLTNAVGNLRHAHYDELHGPPR